MSIIGKYFRVYPIKALRSFSGWDDSDGMLEEANVYLQENYVVTKNIFKDQQVIFQDITPEWVTFCHDQLAFISPAFTQNALVFENGIVLERLPRIIRNGNENLPRVTRDDFNPDHPKPWWRMFEAAYEIPQSLHPTHLKEVVRQLVTQYDGLRLRIFKDETGYQRFIALADPNVFIKQDISSLSDSNQDQAFREIIEAQWANLDLVRGPLLRFVYINCGPTRPAILLLIIHHVLMDGYSLDLFLNDFEDACQQLIQGKSVSVLPSTTSFKAWAEQMDAYCHSDIGKRDFDWWLSLPWERVRLSPVDYPENQVICKVTPNGAIQGYYFGTEETALWGKLTIEETQDLIMALQVYQVGIMDILFTTLALTFYHWQKVSPLFVIACDNNRSFFDNMNLTRMIGYLTSSCPVLLELPNEGITDYRVALNSIKAQLSCIPHNGNPWNWFEKCYPNIIDTYLPNMAHIFFLYNGHTSDMGDRGSSSILRRIKLPARTQPLIEPLQTKLQQNLMAPENGSAIAFGSVADIYNGEFRIRWMYKDGLHAQSTVQTLVQTYLDVLRSFSRGEFYNI